MAARGSRDRLRSTTGRPVALTCLGGITGGVEASVLLGTGSLCLLNEAGFADTAPATNDGTDKRGVCIEALSSCKHKVLLGVHR